MKVKYNDILGFARINLGNKKFPAAMQIAVVGNAEACEAALKTYMEVYDTLAKEHAEKDENGEPVVTENGYKLVDVDAWKKALEELDESEKEIPITMVPVHVYERCCDDPGYDTPTVAETAAMKFFIEM